MPERTDVTGYFTGLAGTYAAYRPGYPAEAFATALRGLPAPADVADVGCGTGIASRALAGLGARVTGIDPNADMLTTAAAAGGPSVPYRAGRAEATGLEDAACDLVLSAQAFHWFDPRAALAEFRRILRPGGRLALVWNQRVRATPLDLVYADVARRAMDDAVARGRVTAVRRDADPTDGGLFTAARRYVFDNPMRLDRAGLVGRARSASYFPPPGPLRDELESMLETAHDAHATDGRVTLSQRTIVTLAEAKAGGSDEATKGSC